MSWYHGGIAGLNPGDLLKPSPPHVTDGCPICVARAEGRSIAVGEYRRWLERRGPQAQPILAQMADVPDSEIMDAPSEQTAVYITTDQRYADWYAARSGHGDVYEVDPQSEPIYSTEDHFTSATCSSARIVRVVRRRVFLTRPERRTLLRAWKKNDEKADREKSMATQSTAGIR